MADSRVRTSIWKGLNRMPYIEDGEMKNMKNLSSDAYPYLTTRKGRKPYTFSIYVPGTLENGGYDAQVNELPEAREELLGKTYRLLEAEEAGLIPGAFYYYFDGKWMQGIKDESFKGVVYNTVTTAGNSVTLYDNTYYTHEYSGLNCPYDNSLYVLSSDKKYDTIYGNIVKYMGDDTETFKKGKTYQYCISVEAYREETPNRSPKQLVEELPEASIYLAQTNSCYKIKADGKVYSYYLKGRGYWAETDVCYEAISKLPENAEEGMQIRWVRCVYGNVLPKGYYLCEEEIDSDGNTVYFYVTTESTDTAAMVSELAEASLDNVGEIYLYMGATPETEFFKCSFINENYKWENVEQPQVETTVTVREYVEMQGKTFKSIIEIAAFLGKIAVLYSDNEGSIHLFYDEQIYDVSNATLDSGKKLSVAGSKLIVGESGNYLHTKDGKTTFHKTPDSFSKTVIAGYAEYGNGGGKYKTSSISGNSVTKEAKFVLIRQWGEDSGYKELYENLKVPGVKFTVSFNGEIHNLTTLGATHEEKLEVYAYKVGDNWHYDYMERLTINATDVIADFQWENETKIENSFSNDELLQITFASSDPHYYDVVTWKKRLWGYEKNVLYGTAADIFDDEGLVDWTRGDNTYLEAISQPIWQGGDITGLAALSNALILFKEDSLTVFTGNYPAIMSASTIPCRGLNAENRESVAVGNENVFYLSQDGVYRYSGEIPRCISRNIKIKGTDAVGASDGNRYWISLKEDNGNYALYVYDINLDIWHREDDTHAESFTMLGGEMYMADADELEIYNINAAQNDVEWEAELWFDEGTHRKKKYKKIIFRGDVGECELFIKGDDDEWQVVESTDDKLYVALEPFLCEELGIKLKGKGICTIKSLDRVFEVCNHE